jgi:chemotaxis protein methyltransferase CheR
VHRLFYQSLIRFGFLALGSKETVQFSAHQAAYEDLGERIYRKVA